MSRKQNSLMRFSRTERLAQLSEQEVVIERKKREIQAKIEAQKKKENEEAFRKLEASNDEKKNNDFNYSSKKNLWKRDGVDKDKEKFIELDKQDSLKNAFSNDGSFLDHFKKMSQSNFSLGKNNSEKDVGINKDTVNDLRQSEIKERESLCAKKTLDSNIQLQLPPPGVVQLVPQQQIMPMLQPVFQNSMPLIPSSSSQMATMQPTVLSSVPQFTTNEIQLKAISSPPFSQSTQSVHSTPLPNTLTSTAASLEKKIESEKNSYLSNSKKASSVHQSLPVSPQNKRVSSSLQKKSEPISRNHTESVSLTFKNNTTKKLESIANPLGDDDDDVLESETSKKNTQIKYEDIKKRNILNLHHNLDFHNPFSSQDEFSKISPAFFNGEQEFGGKEWKQRIENTAKAVAQCGDELEEVLRKCNENEPTMRFLKEKNSREYTIFREKVQQYREEICKEKKSDFNKHKLDYKNTNTEKKADDKSESQEDSPSKYNDGYQGDNEEETGSSKISAKKKDHKMENSVTNLNSEANIEQNKIEERHKRKRKSRWGDMATNTQPTVLTSNLNIQLGKLPAPKTNLLSQLTRSDPGLIQYAKQTFGSTNLSEEDWKKAEDHYKINLLYQDLIKKRAEIKKLEKAGKFKYEYDSDEDVEGGTWEHKLRQQEMMATQLWAEELTRQAAGKHHIGDFLPPEELERFMEKYNAVKEGREPDLSDYKEFKLKEDNVGYRLLQKMGWNEGQGLGQDGSGMTHPVNKAATRHENQGLGLERPDGLEAGDDEYDAYRKRMMLAYRFRPNPLNNPRRPYY